MKHDFKSIRELFKMYPIINVPYYQREYVWGLRNSGRNLYKFIDDIFTQYNKDPIIDYFIGTLAFCSDVVNDVIDGQQRITSLVLILTLLANKKCSNKIQEHNNKLLINDGKFIIQEDSYLSQELMYNLGLPNNFNSQSFNVNISKTIDRITSQIDNSWNGFSTDWYDGLYKYLLDNVRFILIEYKNIGDSLKYFLNINSLSIQLSQSDIFYSILSQAIRISNSTSSIFKIKQKINQLGDQKGLNDYIDSYKSYDKEVSRGPENIIYVFLNAFYSEDSNIGSLNEVGVGKWISFYKNDVFNDSTIASNFVFKFEDYLKDLTSLYDIFSNKKAGSISANSSIYTSWIFLQYESYKDILEIFTLLFKYRHNYTNPNVNLYDDGTKVISFTKLNEIAKRLNLTFIWNYVQNKNNLIEGFIRNIEIDNNQLFLRTISDIKTDINLESIFNLTYNDKKGVSNSNIKDQSRTIMVILALQQATLSTYSNLVKDINEYFQDILLSSNFTIEHLYSVKEFNDSNRLKNWIEKKQKFNTDEEFDSERFSFENLTLLNRSINSSAGSDAISEKLRKYSMARKVCHSEWEFLVLSLVENSEFYSNQNLISLGLPKRTLQNIDQNTWELSQNNRSFNLKALELAIDQIINKS